MNLSELPRLLPTNTTNWIQFVNASGTIEKWSFPQVDASARTAAAGLQAATTLPDEPRIAISGPPGIDWLTAAVACVYLGAAIVAIPESSSRSEQLQLARAHGAALFVTLAVPDASDADASIHVESFTNIVELGRRQSDVAFATPQFHAVAFTSGSSSSSVKSFHIDGEATEHFIESFTDLFDIKATDSWLICHPFSHIVHLEYALGGLCHGYNITLSSPMRVMLGDVGDVPAALVSVPSVYQAIANQIKKKLPTAGIRRRLLDFWLTLPATKITRALARPVQKALAPGAVSKDWHNLKVAIIGAAPSGPDLQRFLILMGLPMYEGYGMSETQMLTCNYPGNARFGTVGKAWPGVTLRLSSANELEARLDARRTTAYIDDPVATAATFSDDGWVRTGDLASEKTVTGPSSGARSPRLFSPTART